jgi:hypothetical protein
MTNNQSNNNDSFGGVDSLMKHSLTRLAIVLILIAATVLFERGKEILYKRADKHFRKVVENLFGELTVLGFLSLCTFCIAQTGFFKKISSKDFEEEELVYMVELTHFMLFFIVVNFVLNVTVLIGQARKVQMQWNKFYRLSQSPSFTEAIVLGKRKSSMLRSLCPDLAEDDLFARYCALQEEFILNRDLDPPFSPTPGGKSFGFLL